MSRNNNQRIIREIFLHPQKRVTVWGGVWSGSVISSYFPENAVDEAVNINGVRYSQMIVDSLWLEMNNINLQNM